MKKALVWILAFLLTGTLILFCVSYIGRQAVSPAMSGDGAQVSDAVIGEERMLAQERVTELADLYGFEAEPVISLISEDTLRELNRQASQWWSMLLQDGEVGDRISWNTDELEQVIGSSMRPGAAEDGDQAEYLSLSAAESVRNSITRMVLPMRQETIRLGMQKIEKKADVVSLISFFMGVPWAALALCALLAGLITLLQDGKSGGSLPYIGSAFGAAALVMIVLAVLYLCAGIQPMIREASEGLAIQYGSMASGAAVRAGVLTAAMAAVCVLCLAISRKNGKTA